MNITHENYPKVTKYVAVWKKAKELYQTNPNIACNRIGWENCFDSTIAKEYCKFLTAMHKRVNARSSDNLYGIRGKKDCNNYHWKERKDQQMLCDHFAWRRVIHQFETKECRRRFAHLITPYGEW